MEYLHQKWILPITLSTVRNQTLEFFSAVLPSTALLLGYHFVLKPRRQLQRSLSVLSPTSFDCRINIFVLIIFKRYFRKAERLLEEENSQLKRRIDDTVGLLSETAKRHMQKEKSRGGTASPHIRARGSHVASRSCHPECEIRTRNGRQEPYDRCNCACTSFSAQQSGSCPRPSHKGSHAYIFSSNYGSRGVLQAGIQGFCDPAPASPKLLRVRYLFRDRQHYAEIPDYVPVVLPLPGVSIVLI